MKDIQGIQRGRCNKCECEEYRCPPPDSSAGRLRCEYCDHTPVDHVKVVPLGACKKCGEDNCDKYEPENPNSYSDCQYCGCAAKYHTGADILWKKPSSSGASSGDLDVGIKARTDSYGKPVQTNAFGTCIYPGCQFPKRKEGTRVFDFCSRTCAEKYGKQHPGGANIPTSKPRATASATSGVHKCCICKSNPANPGHTWCERCFSIAKAQQKT